MVTRIVLDIKKMVPYQSKRDGDGIVLTFEGTAARADLPVQEPVSADVRGDDRADVNATAMERASARHGKGVKDLMASLPTNAITIDFEDAEIRDVLRVMAEMSGINMIYAADLHGFVTIHLDQVPFNENL